MKKIDFYEGLPLEYESFLIERYDSYMTTCRYFEIFFPGYEYCYMIVYEQEKLTDLLAFGIKDNYAVCFNAMVKIEKTVMEACTDKLFGLLPGVQFVKIVLSTEAYKLKKSFLTSRIYDNVLHLPASLDEYFTELGHKKSKNLKNHQKKLMKDFPQAKYVTQSRGNIEESVVNRILHLNKERMIGKGVIPGSDHTEGDDIYRYSLHYGHVTFIEIDGVIIAGNISYVMNKRIIGHVTAHDNEYSVYNPGQICRLHVISEAIDRCLAAYHFMWGNSDFKMRLLAKPEPLYSYVLFRNYSSGFLISSLRAKMSMALLDIRQSNFTKPLRDAIKSYRTRNLRE